MNQPKTHELPARLADLFSRINYERRSDLKPFDFKLDGIRQLLELLNQPHLKYPVIHVAGTKGKGSVSKMIGAVLTANGIRTGVFTSPHLESINQRISVDNQWISDDDLCSTLELIEPAVAEVDAQSQLAGIRPLSFFEVITAAALVHFANVQCQAVVLEVGMGGRLDSTNICQPELCIITTITLDHTRQLGNSLEKIAAEKAGIIKSGVPMICGVEKRKPREVIHQIAAANQADVWQLDSEFFLHSEPDSQGLIVETWGHDETMDYQWRLEDVSVSMRGSHQAKNAAVAIAAIQRLNHNGWKIKEASIRKGLSNLSIPGRCEVIRENPPVVLDIAHNVASIEAFVDSLHHHFPEWQSARRKRLVLSISKDKDSRGIMRWLVDTFDEIILTQFQSNPRARSVADLMEDAEVVRDGLRTTTNIRSAASPLEAWNLVQSDLLPDDFVCITGSVFLVAELRPLLLGEA